MSHTLLNLKQFIMQLYIPPRLLTSVHWVFILCQYWDCWIKVFDTDSKQSFWILQPWQMLQQRVSIIAQLSAHKEFYYCSPLPILAHAHVPFPSWRHVTNLTACFSRPWTPWIAPNNVGIFAAINSSRRIQLVSPSTVRFLLQNQESGKLCLWHRQVKIVGTADSITGSFNFLDYYRCALT